MIKQMRDIPFEDAVEKNIEREDRISITFYTDPLCCWSWAFEKHWRQLVTNYRDRITYKLVMGGMIPDWKSYNDPINSINVPAQMGPLWMYASQVTGTKMHYRIWIEDPPGSSFPASVAVKTVGLQSDAAAEQYLFNIRKAMMEDGVNIAKEKALLWVARNLQTNAFDYNRFVIDWQAGNGEEAFRSDLRMTKFHGIGRFPTLTFQDNYRKGIIIVGHRPYPTLEEAFNYMLKRHKGQ